MKIAYKKKFLRTNVILGSIWSLVGVLQVLLAEQPAWHEYFWIVFGATYFGISLYYHKYKYLTIENGFIRENWPFGKRLALGSIRQVRKFAGDYILKSEDKKLKINTQIIDPDSLAQLDRELEKLHVDWV